MAESGSPRIYHALASGKHSLSRIILYWHTGIVKNLKYQHPAVALNDQRRNVQSEPLRRFNVCRMVKQQVHRTELDVAAKYHTFPVKGITANLLSLPGSTPAFDPLNNGKSTARHPLDKGRLPH